MALTRIRRRNWAWGRPICAPRASVPLPLAVSCARAIGSKSFESCASSRYRALLGWWVWQLCMVGLVACAPPPARTVGDQGTEAPETPPVPTAVRGEHRDGSSLSDQELKQLGEQIRLLTWERIPYSHCHERVPMSLWQVPFHGRRMPPSEQQLLQIEAAIDDDAGALEVLAKDYFELWEWAVGALLVDAFKPERRTAQETRALLSDLQRLSDRAEHFLKEAAAPHRDGWRLYAYQLALLRTGTRDLASVRRDLLPLVPPGPDPQQTARRAQLLLGMVELALLYDEPRALQASAASRPSVVDEASLKSALSRFQIVETHGERPTDPFTLASLCYRAEALLASTQHFQAKQLFIRLAKTKDEYGFQQIAKRRLSEMAPRSEPAL